MHLRIIHGLYSSIIHLHWYQLVPGLLKHNTTKGGHTARTSCVYSHQVFFLRWHHHCWWYPLEFPHRPLKTNLLLVRKMFESPWVVTQGGVCSASSPSFPWSVRSVLSRVPCGRGRWCHHLSHVTMITAPNQSAATMVFTCDVILFFFICSWYLRTWTVFTCQERRSVSSPLMCDDSSSLDRPLNLTCCYCEATSSK